MPTTRKSGAFRLASQLQTVDLNQQQRSLPALVAIMSDVCQQILEFAFLKIRETELKQKKPKEKQNVGVF